MSDQRDDAYSRGWNDALDAAAYAAQNCHDEPPTGALETACDRIERAIEAMHSQRMPCGCAGCEREAPKPEVMND